MKIIIGNSGLVGTVLSEKINFDFKFNSSNINTYQNIIDDGNDLYLSCLPATKWLVNKDIISDLQNINNIVETLKTKIYNKVYLISTIDVYNDSPYRVDESYKPNFGSLSYGNNRHLFEHLIETSLKYNELKIFRLPALFNKKIKKNILYDLIHNNNVDKINSNSKYQWYNLDNLHDDIINFSLEFPSEKIFNLFTEPLETIEIINLFSGAIGQVIHSESKILYDYTTKHNNSGYIKSKDEVLFDIKKLIHEIINK